MVTRSIDNYEKHKEDIFNIVKDKFGEKKADKFISFYKDRFDDFGRSFIDYKLGIWLMEDYAHVKKIGTRWYAFVGVGGSGKSTLAKNVFYYLDPSFDLSRNANNVDELIKVLGGFGKDDILKSTYLDEPDDDISSNSKKGKILRKILGKIRQQKAFLGICATDLKDIPPYIYRKLDGIFFCPCLGKYMFFKNRPKKKSYVIQRIRQVYDKKGYHAFFEVQNDKMGCLNGDTIKSTPLDYQNKEYLEQKRKDYENDIKQFFKVDKAKDEKKQEFDRIETFVNKRIEKGDTHKDIANDLGYSRQRISQIAKKLANAKAV